MNPKEELRKEKKMDNKMKGRIKISIYAIALLMMGVIGITSALATIGANFPDASQTMIQNLISN